MVPRPRRRHGPGRALLHGTSHAGSVCGNLRKGAGLRGRGNGMAGIGFGIRDLLRRDTFLGFFRAYAYAGVIGSGPWILSFAGILLIHILGQRLGIPVRLITQFQTSVTYVIAASLVFSGVLTLSFTRYASDRIYENRPERV